MAERNDIEHSASPVLSMGRGLWLSGYVDSNSLPTSHDSRGVGRFPLLADSGRGTGLSQSPGCTPVGQFKGEGPCTSTPSTDTAVIDRLTDMVGQLGAQIGESIVAKLMSAGLTNISGESQNATATHMATSKVSQEVPHVTVHVKSDREPQVFRGDNSDKYTVQEWIDLTKAYLWKQKCPVADQAEEILSRLMGKAKDVVKIGLRSDQTLDITRDPNVIYHMLIRYFSVTSSCLPLADFYATLPRPGENSVDYWIRINKAADRADEGLRRRGRQMDNISEEVALMFVKHCPDPELSCIFKCRPIHEWSSKDIQGRIDEYQNERRATRTASVMLESHATEVLPQQLDMSTHIQSGLEQGRPLCPSLSPETVYGYAYGNQSSSSARVSAKSQVCHAPSSPSVPVVTPELQQSEDRILDRMVGMMQEMLDKVQQGGSGPPTRGRRFQSGPRERACRVCNGSNHTTISHCMSAKLCFICFSPGHTKLDCPTRASTQPGGN